MDVRKVVFFVYNIMTGSSQYRDRLGGDIFNANNIEFIIFDFSKLFKQDLYAQYLRENKFIYKGNNHIVFENNKEAFSYIKQLNPKTTIVIDEGILGFEPYKSYFLTTGIKFGVQLLNARPCNTSLDSLIKKISIYLKQGWRPFCNKVYNYMFVKSTKELYPSPDFCVASGKKSIDVYNRKYSIKKSTKIIYSHNFDYDYYIKNKKLLNLQQYIVYLDQGIGYNEDEQLMKAEGHVIPCISYTDLTIFFDHVEQLTGIPVVIALHPRMSIQDAEERFPNKTIVHNDVYHLVRKSLFVLAHWSTSIQIAVMLNKKITFLISDSLIKTGFHEEVNAFANELARPVVNIDDKALDDIYFSEEVNEYSYLEYVNNYIKTNGAPANKLSWEIFIDNLVDI